MIVNSISLKYSRVFALLFAGATLAWVMLYGIDAIIRNIITGCRQIWNLLFLASIVSRDREIIYKEIVMRRSGRPIRWAYYIRYSPTWRLFRLVSSAVVNGILEDGTLNWYLSVDCDGALEIADFELPGKKEVSVIGLDNFGLHSDLSRGKWNAVATACLSRVVKRECFGRYESMLIFVVSAVRLPTPPCDTCSRWVGFLLRADGGCCTEKIVGWDSDFLIDTPGDFTIPPTTQQATEV